MTTSKPKFFSHRMAAKNTILAKVDIKHAFCLFPRCHLTMEWKQFLYISRYVPVSHLGLDQPPNLHIMQVIHCLLIQKPSSYNNIMTRAAFSTAFFNFPWSSKLTVPSQDTYHPSVHLSVQDVSVNNKSSSTMFIYIG